MRIDQGDAVGGGILALLRAGAAFAPPIPMPKIGEPPPREFRLFRIGTNPTTKGPLNLTRAGARRVVDVYEAKGHTLCFDLCHSTFDKDVPPENKFAVGHFRLALRDDGIYAVDIQWVEPWGAEISAGKWPFVSPAVLHDRAGNILQIKNAALVTDPATFGAQPTILSALSGEHMNSDPKKRAMVDTYQAGEAYMRGLQTIAEMDGPEREVAQKNLADFAPLMDRMKGCMGTDLEAMRTEMAAAQVLSARKESVFAALSEAYGETDPVALKDKIIEDRLTLLDAQETQQTADQKERETLLADKRIPPAKLGALRLLSTEKLREQIKKLDASPQLPSEPSRETKPKDPTSKEVMTLSDAPSSPEPKPAVVTLSDQDRHVLRHLPPGVTMTEAEFLASKRELAEAKHTNLFMAR